MGRTYRRIKYSKITKWMEAIAIVGIPLMFLFTYLATIGAITITGHSGDMVCSGTPEDPCYAYVNFTANIDIFIYPNQSWYFSTNPPVKEVILQRKWGDGWRTINLSKPCNGRWCGCYWCDKYHTAKYSYVFRAGRQYQIRFVGYKFHEWDNIKWSFDKVDPWWISSYLYCKNIIFTDNIIEVNRTNNPIYVNLTGLNLLSGKHYEIRVVNAPCGENGDEIPYMPFSSLTDNQTWAVVGLLVNKTYGVDTVYSVYYGNPNADKPDYDLYFLYDNFNRSSSNWDKGPLNLDNYYIDTIVGSPESYSTSIEWYDNKQVLKCYIKCPIDSAADIDYHINTNYSDFVALPTRLTYKVDNLRLDAARISMYDAYVGGFHFGNVNFWKGFGNDSVVTRRDEWTSDDIFNTYFELIKQVDDNWTTLWKSSDHFVNEGWKYWNVTWNGDSFSLYYLGSLSYTDSDSTLGSNLDDGSTIVWRIDGYLPSTVSLRIDKFCAISPNYDCNVYDTDLLYSVGSEKHLTYYATFQTSTPLSLNFEFIPSYFSSFSNCSLWTNESGLFTLTQSNQSAISNDSINTISYTFSSNGTYIWNIQCCNNEGECRFFPNNKTLTTGLPKIIFDSDNAFYEYGTYANITAVGKNDIYLDMSCLGLLNSSINSVSYIWKANAVECRFNDSSGSKNFTNINNTAYISFMSPIELQSWVWSIYGHENASQYPENVSIYINNTHVLWLPYSIIKNTHYTNKFNNKTTLEMPVFNINTTYIYIVPSLRYANITFNISSTYQTITDDEGAGGSCTGGISPWCQNTMDENWNTHVTVGGCYYEPTPEEEVGVVYEDYEIDPNLTTEINWIGKIYMRKDDSLYNPGNLFNFRVYVYNHSSDTWVSKFSKAPEYSYNAYPNTGSPENATFSITQDEFDDFIRNNILKTKISMTARSSSDRCCIVRYYESKITYDAYPDITIDLNNDGTYDYYNYSLIGSAIATINDTEINNISCGDTICNVPITFISSRGGNFTITSINVTSYLTDINIQNVSIDDWHIVPVTVNTTKGILEIYNLNITYKGDQNYTVFATDGNSTIAETNLYVRWSNFSIKMPYTFTNDILLYAHNNTESNLQPYGQNYDTPIFNITSLAYTTPANISVIINGSIDPCLTLTISTDNNKTHGTVLSNTSNTVVATFLDYNETTGLWLWADLNNCDSRFVSFQLKEDSCCVNCKPCW